MKVTEVGKKSSFNIFALEPTRPQFIDITDTVHTA